MKPRTQKQPQVKEELCRALDDVDVDVLIAYLFSLSQLFKYSVCCKPKF